MTFANKIFFPVSTSVSGLPRKERTFTFLVFFSYHNTINNILLSPEMLWIRPNGKFPWLPRGYFWYEKCTPREAAYVVKN